MARRGRLPAPQAIKWMPEPMQPLPRRLRIEHRSSRNGLVAWPAESPPVHALGNPPGLLVTVNRSSSFSLCQSNGPYFFCRRDRDGYTSQLRVRTTRRHRPRPRLRHRHCPHDHGTATANRAQTLLQAPVLPTNAHRIAAARVRDLPRPTDTANACLAPQASPFPRLVARCLYTIRIALRAATRTCSWMRPRRGPNIRV